VAPPQGLRPLSSRTVLNVVLGVAVAVLAGIVWLGRSKPPDAPPAYALAPMGAADVRSIEVLRRGTPGIVLRRTDQVWKMEQPLSARVSVVPVSRLLGLLGTTAPSRFPAEDLGRFDLERPWARVTFDGHALDFGATNTLTRELYVKSGAFVYAIPAVAGSAIPPGVATLLDRQLLPLTDDPVEFEMPGFRVAHDGRRWTLDPPATDPSQDDLKAWIDRWRYAASVATRPATNDRMAPSIRLRLRDGRTIELGIVERDPALVLRRFDEGLDYEMPRAQGAGLLARPDAPAPK